MTDTAWLHDQLTSPLLPFEVEGHLPFTADAQRVGAPRGRAVLLAQGKVFQYVN